MAGEEMPQVNYVIARSQSSAVMQRVGGRSYPLRIVKQCHTCQSDYRSEIESKLLQGYGYAKIVRSLPPDAGISVDSVSEHVKRGHLPLAEDVRRVIIEERAKERGLSIEGHHATLADHVTLAKLGVQRTVERLNSGQIEPDLKDGIAFANLLMKIEEMAGESVDQEMLFQTFLGWMRAIQKHTSPEQFRAISAEVSSNPVLRALAQKQAIPAQSEVVPDD